LNAIKNIYNATTGYKTKSGAVLLALYTLIESVAPDLFKGQSEQIVRSSIDFLIITGGADWVYRNRKEIINWITNLFTKKQKNG